MKRRQIPLRLGATAAVMIGLALRLWFVFHNASISGDTLLYGDIAKNWLEHGIYGFTQGAAPPLPTLIRLPGYPFFLAVCFRVFGSEHYTAVMLAQAFIDLFTCVMLSRLAGRLFGRCAALVTLWLAAICPFTANYVSAPLTESLSLACIALAYYSLERWRMAGIRSHFNGWLLPLSTSLAYAILLRPEQGLLAAAILPAMLWMSLSPSNSSAPQLKPRAIAPIILTAFCTILPLIPWTARNWHTFHVIQPLAPRYATDPGEFVPLGFQRWYRTWAIEFASTEDVYWNYDGARVEISDLPTRAYDSEDQYLRTDSILAEYNKTNIATAPVDARFDALASERIAADPIRYYLALPVARLLNMAFRPRTEMLPISLEWWKWSEDHVKTTFAAFYAVLNFTYFALGGVGFYLWRHRTRNGSLWSGNPAMAWAMAASILLRCALLLTLDNSEPRYTLEFFPVLFVWAGALFTCIEPVASKNT
jgi:hypothetical protein